MFEPIINVTRFETHSELANFVKGKAHVLLGFDSEPPLHFFCVEIVRTNERFYVGVASYSPNPDLEHTASGANLYIGFNKQVAIISLTNLRFYTETDLCSLFWQFIINAYGIRILCETAVVALSSAGSVQWRVDTDLIKSFFITNEVVALEFFDDSPMQIDLRSGLRETGKSENEG